VVEQSDLLKMVLETLERLHIPYAIVGSFASGIWGESRFTQDIDIVVDLDAEQVKLLGGAFPDPEFYISQTAADEAVERRGQFNVIHPTSGNKIDFMVVGHDDWGRALLARRKGLAIFAEQTASVAAPEDVILGKLLYYREGGSEKHLRDITGILKISGDVVDREYVTRFANQLGLTDLWQAVLARLEGN
jgi:hypothetical protein